jgi:hypothetical protein
MARATTSLLLAFLGACSSTASPSRTEANKAPMNSPRTDLAALARWLTPPPGAKSARWLVRPRGVADPNVPGPTDTVLTAYIEIDAAKWAELEAVMKRTGPSELELDEDVASALLPSAGGLPQRKGLRVVGGPTYQLGELPRSPYVGEVAVRYHDGLVLQLFSQ